MVMFEIKLLLVNQVNINALFLFLFEQMINLYRDPKCKSVTVKIKPKDVPGTTKTAFDNFVGSQNVETMQKKIKELESRVELQQRQIKFYTECNSSSDIHSGNNRKKKQVIIKECV